MRLLIAALIAMALGAPAWAASLDPDRIAAIDQAADAFLAKAAAAKKIGMVPRQSDPAVAGLLDTVFDIGALSHGTIDYADEPKLIDWLNRLTAVGGVYISTARAARDTGLFGAEIGRFSDAAAGVMRAIVDSQMAEIDAHPEVELSAADQRSLAEMRTKAVTAFASLVGLVEAPGVTVGWAQERVAALTAAAPGLARFLMPEQLAHLRVTVLQLAARYRQKTLRQSLGRLAVALAEPPPPTAVAAAVPGTGEIPLKADEAGGYSVPVRVNDAVTADFIVDSGASVVALPKDMVDNLTKTGAITPGDMLGRSIFVAADGKHHRSINFMLRRLDVAGHIVTNVMAAEVPAHNQPLLGMSFLAKFKSWTLDNKRHVLVLGE